jgi:predicted nucleic acid-binding protein
LTWEPATDRAWDWFHRQDPTKLLISDWVAAEFSSALSIKLRTKQMRLEDRAKASGLFASMRADSLKVMPVTREHFETAALFAGQYELGLRSSDALHIAVALGLGATICTMDKRMAEAAVVLGVSAELV